MGEGNRSINELGLAKITEQTSKPFTPVSFACSNLREMFSFLILALLTWSVSLLLPGSVSPPASCTPSSSSTPAVATRPGTCTAFLASFTCLSSLHLTQGFPHEEEGADVASGNFSTWEILVGFLVSPHRLLQWSAPHLSSTEKHRKDFINHCPQTEHNNRAKRGGEDNKQTPSHKDVLMRQISDAEQSASPLKWHFYI